MKILFLADGCHPATQGGIQTFGRALKKMFGKKIIFLSNYTSAEKIFEVDDVIEVLSPNIFFRLVDKFSNRALRNYIYYKQIKKLNPDICILRAPTRLCYFHQCGNINTKKILVQHTSFDFYFDNYYGSDLNLLELSKKELDCFVVLSEEDKIACINKLRFPENKIKVIRHSCDIDINKNKKIKNKNLIMIARISNEEKRLDLAIKAMKQLPDYHLKIYGSGSDEEMLKQLIQTENINNVELCGPTNQVQNVLDENSIFIMTSDYEGYPITTIEAMRRGLPIILRNTFPAANDVVKDNGILLDSEWNEDAFCNAVREVYDNYEVYSKNAIEMGRRHDLGVIKQQWENLFNELKDCENE